jgi:endonuclease/exonuclease/phosphatase family metal-dependent hydrolase
LALLVRTWNVFHGNAEPPERRTFLADAVRLASADAPDVLCLQELPVWSLRRLEEWSGMRAVGVVASRPRPLSAELGRVLTGVHYGRLRSAFTGQANAILFARRLNIREIESIVLNPAGVRGAQARALRLPRRLRLAWASERRVCQAVRLDDGARTLVLANLHASSVPDRRIPDIELLRAATFADAFAEPEEPVVLAGDFNVRRETSVTLEQLSGPDWGFSRPIPWLDQILGRGVQMTTPEPWPEERRRVDGRLLSDHAPVEARVE